MSECNIKIKFLSKILKNLGSRNKDDNIFKSEDIDLDEPEVKLPRVNRITHSFVLFLN